MKFKILLSTLILAASCLSSMTATLHAGITDETGLTDLSETQDAMKDSQPNELDVNKLAHVLKKSSSHHDMAMLISSLRHIIAESRFLHILNLDIPWIAQRLVPDIYQKYASKIERDLSEAGFIESWIAIMHLVMTALFSTTIFYPNDPHVEDVRHEFRKLSYQFFFITRLLESLRVSFTYLFYYQENKYGF